MKNQRRVFVLLCTLMLFTLSCSLGVHLGKAGSGGTAEPGQDNAQNSSGTGEDQSAPQGESTVPAEGETLYFPAFPADVSDATGTLTIIAARALKGMKELDIIVVLENKSPDPLQIYESLDWQAKAFDAGGNVIGQTSSTERVGFAPGQKTVLRAWVDKWEGEAARFGLEITSGKARFIQEDMQDKFRALKMPSPQFTVDAQPFTLTDNTFFDRKVIRTQANAVVHNPNPGVAKNVETTAVYYDADGQIIGYAKGDILEIPAGSQASVVYEGVPYYAGNPVKAEYYAFQYDPYYIEELFKMW
jgi:hypothetical protein